MINKKLIFSAACLGMLLFGIGLITLGSVATGLKEKYLLNEISSGTLFSILPVGILVGSLVFGRHVRDTPGVNGKWERHGVGDDRAREALLAPRRGVLDSNT